MFSRKLIFLEPIKSSAVGPPAEQVEQVEQVGRNLDNNCCNLLDFSGSFVPD